MLLSKNKSVGSDGLFKTNVFLIVSSCKLWEDGTSSK